jgi:hypothetical protein
MKSCRPAEAGSYRARSEALWRIWRGDTRSVECAHRLAYSMKSRQRLQAPIARAGRLSAQFRPSCGRFFPFQSRGHALLGDKCASRAAARQSLLRSRRLDSRPTHAPKVRLTSLERGRFWHGGATDHPEEPNRRERSTAGKFIKKQVQLLGGRQLGSRSNLQI